MAAFWADVDTRGTGTISYRETNNTDLLQRASSHIKRAFPTIAVSLDYLFIATWDHVGFFDKQSMKVTMHMTHVLHRGPIKYMALYSI